MQCTDRQQYFNSHLSASSEQFILHTCREKPQAPQNKSCECLSGRSHYEIGRCARIAASIWCRARKLMETSGQSLSHDEIPPHQSDIESVSDA
eukprot:6371648-Amphidinium_carterae.1